MRRCQIRTLLLVTERPVRATPGAPRRPRPSSPPAPPFLWPRLLRWLRPPLRGLCAPRPASSAACRGGLCFPGPHRRPLQAATGTAAGRARAPATVSAPPLPPSSAEPRLQPNVLGAARRGPAPSDQSRRASRPASALRSPPGPARTGLHSGAARAAAAGAAAAHRGALQVVPGEAAAVPGQDVLQAHVHPATCRGGGEAGRGARGFGARGGRLRRGLGAPRGLCSPAGDRAAPGAFWPLTSGATWPAPRKTKERRCPWAGLASAFLRVGEERRGPRGPVHAGTGSARSAHLGRTSVIDLQEFAGP